MARAFSHLSERSVYVEFLQNLAGSYPPPNPDIIPGHNAEDADRSRTPDPSVNKDGKSCCGNGRLTEDLATHRGRVSGVLRRLQAGDDARYIMR